MRILLTGNTGFKIANFRAGLIRALMSDGYEVDVLVPRDEFNNHLTEMGCRVFPLYMRRNSVSLWHESLTLLSIFIHLLRHRPAIVFGYTIKNNIFGGISCSLLGIPFVANVTGLGPTFNQLGFLNALVIRLYQFAFRKAQKVFFQNTEDRRVFLEAGILSEERTGLLPGSGVDLEKFDETPLHNPNGERVFLLVSRLIREKGIHEFCEAARKVKATHPKARFRILGPFDPDSKSAVTPKELEDWTGEAVEYLGEARDVREHLRAAHCVVLPSFYKEGTPRILLEAAATGRPVITTNLPGCRDTIEDGVTGYLVLPLNAEDLATKIRHICDQPAGSLVEMAQKARSRAQTQFDEKLVIDAYRELIG